MPLLNLHQDGIDLLTQLLNSEVNTIDRRGRERGRGRGEGRRRKRNREKTRRR